MTHSNPHICVHCEKSFYNQGDLTKHVKIHRGVKKQIYNLCDKTFEVLSDYLFEVDRNILFVQQKILALCRDIAATIWERDLWSSLSYSLFTFLGDAFNAIRNSSIFVFSNCWPISEMSSKEGGELLALITLTISLFFVLSI